MLEEEDLLTWYRHMGANNVPLRVLSEEEIVKIEEVLTIFSNRELESTTLTVISSSMTSMSLKSVNGVHELQSTVLFKVLNSTQNSNSRWLQNTEYSYDLEELIKSTPGLGDVEGTYFYLSTISIYESIPSSSPSLLLSNDREEEDDDDGEESTVTAAVVGALGAVGGAVSILLISQEYHNFQILVFFRLRLHRRLLHRLPKIVGRLCPINLVLQRVALKEICSILTRLVLIENHEYLGKTF